MIATNAIAPSVTEETFQRTPFVVRVDFFSASKELGPNSMTLSIYLKPRGKKVNIRINI